MLRATPHLGGSAFNLLYPWEAECQQLLIWRSNFILYKGSPLTSSKIIHYHRGTYVAMSEKLFDRCSRREPPARDNVLPAARLSWVRDAKLVRLSLCRPERIVFWKKTNTQKRHHRTLLEDDVIDLCPMITLTFLKRRAAACDCPRWRRSSWLTSCRLAYEFRDAKESTEFERFRKIPPLFRSRPAAGLSRGLILDIIVNRSFSETPVDPLKWILLIALIMVPVRICQLRIIRFPSSNKSGLLRSDTKQSIQRWRNLKIDRKIRIYYKPQICR